MKTNIFVILGMGRSGTSAIARGLKVLGINLGEKLRVADNDNPKGFWEDGSVLGINRMLSRSLGDPMMNVSLIDELSMQSQQVFTEFQTHAENIINKRTEQTKNWGFKDPRTIIFLPFWRSVFTTLKVEDHYIICIRNPLSCVKSNNAFSANDPEMIYIMWVTNMIAAINQTQGKKRVVVSYELLIDDAVCQLERIKKTLSIPFTINKNEMDVYINKFLDKKLVHFKANEYDSNLISQNITVSLCFRVYNLLMRVAKDELSFDSDEFIDNWRDIENDFSKIYPAYQYIHRLASKNSQLNKKIADIRDHLPGCLIYPFVLLKKRIRLTLSLFRHRVMMKGFL